MVYTEIETPLTGLVSIAEVALCLQRSVETRKNFLFIHRWDGLGRVLDSSAQFYAKFKSPHLSPCVLADTSSMPVPVTR